MFEGSPSSKCPLNYIGSKGKIFPIFRDLLPKGITELVSPFCGGGSLELKVAAMGIRVYGYDIHFPISNFYQEFNKDSKEVIKLVNDYYPLTKSKFKSLCKIEGWENLSSVEAAALWWMVTKWSWGGMGLTSRGVFNYSDTHPCPSLSYFNLSHWKNWKNDYFSCEQVTWQETLKNHPNSILYCDPPYVGKERYYGFDSGQQSFPHEELRDTLAARSTPWILSYGRDPLIEELYADFTILKYLGKKVSDKYVFDRSNLLILNNIDLQYLKPKISFYNYLFI